MSEFPGRGPATGRHRLPDPGEPAPDRPPAPGTIPPRTAHQLALETLVSTTEQGYRLRRLLWDRYARVCELCVATMSVVELSAHLGLPLGTTRTLVEDLLAERLLRAHQPVGTYASEARTEVLDRVLDGLDRL
ncbi:DUF742 domain-containing protein [Amycolatopsis sp. PS_44_ISF1]|uniref:DUF742 domain-containing protein n=1 Tax=Amycolatopsis sp. PS_44_ISF1 TaxID=2974917 RepID=UPI0028DE837C|nr:DUF742 domain-containing protein [Amycolatopsis sp. PS_44_ISF1]MDT8915917.1 DUF742 domain-containing protein [Amycolatopsis sp. PS_44_ISF1]